MDKPFKVIKVSRDSSVPQVAGCIAICVEEGKKVEVRAMGASSISQAYKGITCARSILSSKGIDILILPGFDEVVEENGKRTVMTAKLVIR